MSDLPGTLTPQSGSRYIFTLALGRLLAALAGVLGSAALLAQAPAPVTGPSAAPRPLFQNPDAAAPLPAVPGIGDLLVAPTRIVFEGRTRSAELTLVNRGSQAATYRISFTHLRMLANGDLKEVEQPEPGEVFADELIRYSPRQVTLEPNLSQTVRLQVRKPESLPDGEYRSHLLFRAVPPAGAAPGNIVDGDEKNTVGYSVLLTPIFGVSIPVIVRQGKTSARVSLTDLTVKPAETAGGPAILELTIRRDGNQSVYGNVRVAFISSTGQQHVLGIFNGLAVYTPNPDRLVRVPLQPPPGVVLGHGRLRVRYTRAEQNGDVLAEAETSLP